MNIKRLGHILFGLCCLPYRLLPLNQNKTVLFMIHNDHKCGNLKYMYDSLSEKRPNDTYIFISKAELFSGENKLIGLLYFYFVLSFHLMTAGSIYLNDNFLPLAYMPLRKSAKVIQLWHGIGAFKRFGLSTEKDQYVRQTVEEGNKRITHLFVSGKAVIPYYEEAFRVSRDRIFPVGLPVLDFYFDDELKKAAKENFYRKFKGLENKKILLYTPTFRKSMAENEAVLKAFSVSELKEELGEEWAILIRLHPTISDSGIIKNLGEDVYDVSFYEDVKELYEVSDVLVNDYSSTAVEYALLRKPIVCFVPDFDKYDRGFYRDYEENAVGEIVKDFSGLLSAIRQGKSDDAKLDGFLKLHYDYFDSNNRGRILDILYR